MSRPKPAAEVLLVDPDPARESRFGKMPVMAVQQYGLGQVMYIGTDNTWRWRKNVGDLYYTTIWGQVAQRVSLQRLLGGSKRTQLTTDRQNYTTGDRVLSHARLYSAGFEPIQEQSVKGFVALKSAQETRTEVTLRADSRAARLVSWRIHCRRAGRVSIPRRAGLGYRSRIQRHRTSGSSSATPR